MPLFDNLKSAWSALIGKSGPPPGSYGVGYGGGSIWSDGFKSRRAPSPAEMVEAYKSICYVCANLNVNGVARTPLRLFVTTKGGQHVPKCPTKAVSRLAKIRLKSLAYSGKAMANAQEVEEVTEHPLLDAVMKVNDDLDFAQLISFTVLSLDITGNAYWWPSMGNLGIPKEIWAMPSHLVFPQFQAGSMVPDSYTFGGINYPKDSLVRFRRLSAKNPYGQGYSPLQAAIEYARLEDVWVSTQDDMLSNGPRPSVIISPKDANSAMGEAERKRFEHDMNQKGRGGRTGSAFVFGSGAVAVTPVSYSPTDVGGMQVGMYDLERIANCFDVPVSMLKTEDVNRANADAGLEQHARNGIEPRCKLIASTLTRWTHSLDPRGKKGWDRLIWAFDPAVKEDAEAEADLHRKYIDMGLPLNVALTEAGYDAVEGGDVSFVASNLTTLENAVKPPEPPMPPGGKPGEDPDDDGPPPKGKDDESKAIDDEIAEVLGSMRTKLALLPDAEAKGVASDWVWDAELKRYVPCRDESGRFASCDGAGGSKPKKPGAGKKPAKKPKDPKPAKKPAAPKEPAKPKEPKPKKPAAPKPPKEKPTPAPKPAKPATPKPVEPKPPKEAKPKPEKPAKEKPKPAEKPATNYREFKESHDAIQQMTKWGKGQSKGWHDSLSPTEASAVKEYGTNTYGVLNGLLRGKSFSEIKREASYFIPAGMTAAKAKTLLKDTKAAFGKARLSEPVVLFRGIKERGGLVPDLDALKPGSIITEKGFVSTSLDRGIASEFAGPSQIFKSNLVMRIKAPAGTKGAYIDAGGLATFKEAQEVTLAAGTKYRYVGRSKMPGVAGDVDVMDVEIIP